MKTGYPRGMLLGTTAGSYLLIVIISDDIPLMD